MPKTIFILADSALELIPNKIAKSQIIKNHAKKKGKLPTQILLDSSYHFKAMLNLKEAQKRGRPDILHICLLNLLGSTLALSKKNPIEIIVHTIDKKIIMIDKEVRLPRNYNRFVGLFEQLLTKEEIRTKDKVLLKILDIPLDEKIKNIPRKNIFIFSSKGRQVNLLKQFESFSNEDIVVIIGAFPHGSFSKEIRKLSDNIFSIHTESLNAWIVINNVIFSRKLTISQ